MTTEVYFGARSDEWARVRAVADLGMPLHVAVHGLACRNLFLVQEDHVAHLGGTEAPPGIRYIDLRGMFFPSAPLSGPR